ncbi:hypothetical protein TNCV_1290731 [Trichonephila clavipes]|nr:hypothetical protein TNCV_1290731 [Trichonephila clavipes]
MDIYHRHLWQAVSMIFLQEGTERKEKIELAERKKKKDGNSGKEETGRFRAEDEDMEMEFETQKKLIELEGEVRSNLSSETRLKVEVEDRLKADEEAKAVEDERKMEKERRMNEIIALGERNARLKKEKDGLWKSRCCMFKRNVKQS